MTASTSIPLSTESHNAFIEYYKTIQQNSNTLIGAMRSKFEEIDKQYQREKDLTYDNQQSKQANKRGDADKFRNITVPVVMPQVETAVTYQTSVFLQGYPIFGVVSPPAFMDEALQMETVVADQAQRGRWTADIIKSFRGGFK